MTAFSDPAQVTKQNKLAGHWTDDDQHDGMYVYSIEPKNGALDLVRVNLRDDTEVSNIKMAVMDDRQGCATWIVKDRHIEG